MFNCSHMHDYVVVGTMHSDPNIEVLVAYKGTNDPKNLYILNKIPFNERNQEIFKKFFFCFQDKNKVEDFEDMFVYDNNFYLIFKYVRCNSIKFKYAKDICVTVFDQRCDFLQKILIKFDRLSNFPIGAFASLTRPENVCVDEENKLRICYNFSTMFEKELCTKTQVYRNIHKIIYSVLQREADVKYNKALHIVLERCQNGIYKSIPQLAVDLKEASKTSKSTSLFSYIKYQISLRKDKIMTVTKYATSIAIAFGMVYLGYTKLFQRTGPASVTPVVAIGEVTYNGNTEDESSKEVSTEKTKVKEESSYAEIALSPGLDIEYEDHIVQYGETITDICEAYYKDASLANAVATFNDMEIDEKLVAGTILRLPNKTAIALYISN